MPFESKDVDSLVVREPSRFYNPILCLCTNLDPVIYPFDPFRELFVQCVLSITPVIHLIEVHLILLYCSRMILGFSILKGI